MGGIMGITPCKSRGARSWFVGVDADLKQMCGVGKEATECKGFMSLVDHLGELLNVATSRACPDATTTIK